MLSFFNDIRFKHHIIGDRIDEGYDFDHRPISYGTRVMLTHNISISDKILPRGSVGIVLIPDSAQPNRFNISNMSAIIYRGHTLQFDNYEYPVEVEPYKLTPLEEYPA